MSEGTRFVQAGRNAKAQSGSVNPPVHRTSTVLFPTLKAYHEAETGNPFYPEAEGIRSTDYSYGILGTPTHYSLQKALAEIEGGKHALVYPSGLSAITSVLLTFLAPGDHVLVTDSIYGPTRRFCNKELSRLNIETTYYDPAIGSGIKKLIQKNTKLIFTEAPGSLTFEMQDIPAITKVAREKDIPVVMDNSWATSYFFKPFDHGVDISLQAGTKYIGGHSDILIGTVVTKSAKLHDALVRNYRHYGTHVSPDDCYLAARGLRTMHTRLKAHEASALNVAQWLEKRKEVAQVLHPALPSHPGHAIWKRDFTGSSGLFTFILDKHYSKTAIADMIDHMKIFGIGASWGGYESLIIHFDPSLIRTATSWDAPGTAIRVYIGLEDEKDIIKDLTDGFKRLKSHAK